MGEEIRGAGWKSEGVVPVGAFKPGMRGGEGPGGQSGGGSTKVVNLFDSASFLSEALNSKVGEKAILNWVRANPAAFKAALGG